MPSDLSSARFGAERGSVSLSRKEWVSIVRLNIHKQHVHSSHQKHVGVIHDLHIEKFY